ncbi:MAG: hypothetical protein BWY48_00171 [Parcubacteria group bacterium ADurb.Bin305]|nr:MAG: hypothetical protein BWY48_00171 [Parcubacteria group bacterium ADurb.Bin305]
MTTLLKKFIPILIISLAMILVVGSAQASDLNPEIQVQESWVDYQFEVGIPMIVKAGTKLQAGSLPQYVSMLIYRVIFPVSGILGFIMILWAGVEYMVAGGSVEHQKAAQQRIIDALAGLLLLFAFWIILNTINPNILKLPDIGLVMGKYLGLDTNEFAQQNLADRLGSLISQEAVTGSMDDYIWEGASAEGANNGATRKDLLDKAKNRCIDPKENSTNPEDNCINKVDWATKTSDGCPSGQVSIKDDILEVLAAILDPNYSNTCDGKKRTTRNYLSTEGGGCNFVIGPFVSDHNYCPNPNSKHATGEAFDLEADADADSFPNANSKCRRLLANLFCLEKCNTGREMTIGGKRVYVLYECDEKGGNQHIHIELR